MSSHSLPPLLLSIALLPAFAHAEGAVRVLDCSVTQECDGAGECKAAAQDLEFRMEPIELANDGSGRYTIHYNGQSAEMQALSEAGPFHWRQDTERHTLLASSDTLFLWHNLTFDTMPVARIRFLNCRVRQ